VRSHRDPDSLSPLELLDPPNGAAKPLEDFFRHEYGRLVASLCRRVGVQSLEAIEDAAQDALLIALQKWKYTGLPERPGAWLYRVAHNQVIEHLRSQARHRRILEEEADSADIVQTSSCETEDAQLGADVDDDLLRMIFVCCDETVPAESQLVLALKVLCGFSVHEIAVRLFISEANAYKRLNRARGILRDSSSRELTLEGDAIEARLRAVHKVIYLLFTEGYLSVHPSEAIREELCREAIRLALLLSTHPAGHGAETYALLALMHFHVARLPARQNGAGMLLLLEEQDRSLWHGEAISEGVRWMARSAQGDRLSQYHLEAAIAAEHCLAPSFRETKWEKIAPLYERLEALTHSPLHRLSRALAVAEWKGPEHGLSLLSGQEPPTWFRGTYLWWASLSDLHRRAGRQDVAKRYRDLALEGAPNRAVREVLSRRLSLSE